MPNPTRAFAHRAPLSFQGILALAALPLVLALLIILLTGGDWRVAAGVVVVAFVLLGSIVPPDFLMLSALLAFIGASMPIVNRGEVLGLFRWVMLFALGLGMALRNTVRSSSSRWHPIHLSLGLFVFYAAISSSWSANGLMTLLKAASFGCLAMAAILYGRLESPHQSGSPCRLLEYLYWCAVLVAIGCILRVLHVLPPGAGDFAGPLGNPNGLGAFISLVAPILLLKAFQSSDKGPLTRAANAALPIAFLMFVLMSRSRAGIVSSFLACGWWLFFSYRKVFGVFVGSALLSAVVISAYFPRYLESLDEVYIRKGGAYALQTREDLMRVSWEAAMESPLIGVGFGVSKGYSEGWEFEFATGEASREKGNSYLALLEEVGVVGSTFLVLSIAWLFIASAQRLLLLGRFYPSSEEFWTTLTLSACLMGGLGDAFFEAWLTAAGFFSAIMFWLVFGVLAARLTTPLRIPR